MGVGQAQARRWTARSAVAAALAALAVAAGVAEAPAAARTVFPDVIALPPGWQPEGIAAGRGHVMYSGSRATGDVLAFDVVTGETRLAVDAPPGRSATGLEEDAFGRLWVSGGGAGRAYVYGHDGAPPQTLQLATTPGPTFVNDVVITSDAAWFTDSQRPVLYKVPIGPGGTIGQPQVLPLTGGYAHAPGFNLNGIDATPGGRWLRAVQSNTGALYRIDPDTGEAVRIDLGGAVLTAGDGVLVQGRRVHVVRNNLNRVAVIEMNPRTFASGRVVDELTSPNFDVPTTIASFGNRFYLVNARFGVPATTQTPYSMIAIPRR